MMSMSFNLGSFTPSAAGSAQAVGVVAPKMQVARLLSSLSSPSYSPVRNIRDEYVPSAPASARNTYSPPSKGVQNGANLVFKLHNRAEVEAKTADYWARESKDISLFHKNKETLEQPAFQNIVEEIIGGNVASELEDPDDDWTRTAILTDLEGNVFLPSRDIERPWWTRAAELRERLEQNPGALWQFDIGDPGMTNKDYKGHDILDAIFPKVYQSVTSLTKVRDEYGYTFCVPAYSAGGGEYNMGRDSLPEFGPGTVNFTVDFTVWSRVYDTEIRPEHELLSSKQMGGLDYLTLEEIDIFYAEVQKIFDRNGLQLDARNERYVFLPSRTPDPSRPAVGCNAPFPGGWQWTNLDGNADHKTVQNLYSTIADEMMTNSAIRSLFEKAEKVQKGIIPDDTLAQQYSIRVTDNDGNRLANDRIIVEAKNGNQVAMSVEQFSQMSRMDITKLLR